MTATSVISIRFFATGGGACCVFVSEVLIRWTANVPGLPKAKMSGVVDRNRTVKCSLTDSG